MPPPVSGEVHAILDRSASVRELGRFVARTRQRRALARLAPEDAAAAALAALGDAVSSVRSLAVDILGARGAPVDFTQMVDTFGPCPSRASAGSCCRCGRGRRSGRP